MRSPGSWHSVQTLHRQAALHDRGYGGRKRGRISGQSGDRCGDHVDQDSRCAACASAALCHSETSLIATIHKVLFPALVVTMLALTEAVSISRAIAVKSEQRIDGNQEFIGQGIVESGGQLFFQLCIVRFVQP